MKQKMTKNYEKDYHLMKHNYLYNDAEYYLVRAKLALEKYFKETKSKSSILDYGCGLGQNIFLVNNSTGYDISDFALDFCRKKGINVTKNLKNLKNNSFDIVFSCEVLEHLENPLKELKMMKSKLKEKGKLILIIPLEKLKKPSFEPDSNQHLYCWNYQTMTNLLSRIGFIPISYEIIKMTGFKKLIPINRVSFKLYLLLTKCLAIIVGSKHLKIIAVKK